MKRGNKKIKKKIKKGRSIRGRRFGGEKEEKEEEQEEKEKGAFQKVRENQKEL